MDKKEAINRLELILDEVSHAILAVNDKNGFPHMRWMTPAILNGKDGILFAVTTKEFSERILVEYNPMVEWMVQKNTLSEIMNIKGSISVINVPSLGSEIIEKIGNKLRTFWNVNIEEDEYVILETKIDSITWFSPGKSKKVEVEFKEEVI